MIDFIANSKSGLLDMTSAADVYLLKSKKLIMVIGDKVINDDIDIIYSK
jgi:hypothetical protein